MSDKLTANEQAGLSNRFYATDPTRIQIEIFEKLLALSSLPSQQAPGKDGLRECPNPWCGRNAPAYGNTYTYDNGQVSLSFLTFIFCPQCRIQGPTCLEESEAIAAWNTRPSAAPQEQK